MFKELATLVGKSEGITFAINGNGEGGRLVVSVLPRVSKENTEPALSTPLILTGTPDELDEGFVAALQQYTQARQGLLEQAEATVQVLKAAKEALAARSASAVAKATKKVAPAAAAESDDGASDEDDNAAGGGADEPSSEPTKEPATTSGVPNLFA